MSVYDYDITTATLNLLPPCKRLQIWIALMGISDYYYQKLHDIFFYSYKDGDSSSLFVLNNNYSYEDTVLSGFAIYGCINPNGITAAIIPPLDVTNWQKIEDLFIGVRERANYTSSKIMIEYALNRWFNVGNPSLPFYGGNHHSQIYLNNNLPQLSAFWLSKGHGRNSYMAKDSRYQINFLGNSYAINQNSFTIYVPISIFNSLGQTPEQREGAIRAIADKYVPCGKTYNVQTYT